MLNQDLHFRLKLLNKRIGVLEDTVSSLSISKSIDDDVDWDNSMLMIKWQISQRTAANYRNQGLEYYKVGGRIYYTQQQRQKFIELTTNKSNLNHKQIEE